VDSGDDSMERQLNLHVRVVNILCFAFSLSLSTLYWA
jgi:hypothetical protein